MRFHKGDNQYANKSFTRLDDAKTWQSDMQRAKETGRVQNADADLITLSALAAEDMTARRPDMEKATFDNYRALWAATSARIRSRPCRCGRSASRR